MDIFIKPPLYQIRNKAFLLTRFHLHCLAYIKYAHTLVWMNIPIYMFFCINCTYVSFLKFIRKVLTMKYIYLYMFFCKAFAFQQPFLNFYKYILKLQKLPVKTDKPLNPYRFYQLHLFFFKFLCFKLCKPLCTAFLQGMIVHKP